MKTVSLADFKKKTSGFLTEVEQGEALVLLWRGKPVAEVSPCKRDSNEKMPSWKKPGVRLKAEGMSLSSIILEERKSRDEGIL